MTIYHIFSVPHWYDSHYCEYILYVPDLCPHPHPHPREEQIDWRETFCKKITVCSSKHWKHWNLTRSLGLGAISAPHSSQYCPGIHFTSICLLWEEGKKQICPSFVFPFPSLGESHCSQSIKEQTVYSLEILLSNLSALQGCCGRKTMSNFGRQFLFCLSLPTPAEQKNWGRISSE